VHAFLVPTEYGSLQVYKNCPSVFVIIASFPVQPNALKTVHLAQLYVVDVPQVADLPASVTNLRYS